MSHAVARLQGDHIVLEHVTRVTKVGTLEPGTRWGFTVQIVNTQHKYEWAIERHAKERYELFIKELYDYWREVTGDG